MSFHMPATIATRDHSATRQVVSLADGAIDRAKSDLGAYRDGFELRHIATLPGESLTVFDVRPLSVDEVDAIDAGPGTLEAKALRYFRAGCLRASGVVMPATTSEGTYLGTVSGKHLEVMPAAIRLEVGLYIRRLSEYVPDGFFGPSPESSSTDSGD